MAPVSRAAAAKASKKRQVREKAAKASQESGSQEQEVEGSSSTTTTLSNNGSNGVDEQANDPSYLPLTQQDFDPELILNPPLNPKTPEELSQLKRAIHERARIQGDTRMLATLHPPNPSVGLRKLPYTPITPPGVSWTKSSSREREDDSFYEMNGIPPGLSRKKKIRYLKNMMRASGGMPLVDMTDIVNEDEDDEEEDEEEKGPQEDRTIHAPLAHRLLPRTAFHAMHDRFAVMRAVVEGKHILCYN